jgi:hypothetical protein
MLLLKSCFLSCLAIAISSSNGFASTPPSNKIGSKKNLKPSSWVVPEAAAMDTGTNGDAAVVESHELTTSDNDFLNSETEDDIQEDDELDGMTMFEIIAGRAASCLLESDKRRNAMAEHSNRVASGVSNWIDDVTAFALQKAFNRVKLKVRCVEMKMSWNSMAGM